MEKVYRQQLQDFLDSEIADKPNFSTYDIYLTEYVDNESASYIVSCAGYNQINFEVRQEEDSLTLYIEHVEDWKEIEYFEWTVKYFWMELLR